MSFISIYGSKLLERCHLSCMIDVKFIFISSSGLLAELEFELKKSDKGA